jgi:hypothetical protein
MRPEAGVPRAPRCSQVLADVLDRLAPGRLRRHGATPVSPPSLRQQLPAPPLNAFIVPRIACPSVLRLARSRLSLLREWRVPPVYFLIAVIYVALRVGATGGLHSVRWPDTATYEYQQSVGDFLAGLRPWTVAVLYHLVPDETLRGYAQVTVALICWLALAAVVAASIRDTRLRIIAFATTLALSLAPNVLGWDFVLLSESVSLSLAAAFVAAWLAFIGWMRWQTLVVLVAIALLWIFTRDSNAYVVLTTVVLLAISLAVRGKRRLRGAALGGMVLVFAASYISYTAGPSYHTPDATRLEGRWVPSLLDILGKRAFKDPQAVAYFESHGMPVNQPLRSVIEQPVAHHPEFLETPGLTSFRRWIASHGRTTYVRYSLEHPGYGIQAPAEDWRVLLFPNVSSYYELPRGAPLPEVVEQNVYAGSVGTMLFYTVIAVTVAGWAAWRGAMRLACVVPAGLLLSTIPHALVIWHGSGLELERHAISLAVLFRVAIILLLFLSVDALLTQRQSRISEREYARDSAPMTA